MIGETEDGAIIFLLATRKLSQIDFDDETVLETAGFIIECLPFAPMCCQTGACSRDGTCAKKEEV